MNHIKYFLITLSLTSTIISNTSGSDEALKGIESTQQNYGTMSQKKAPTFSYNHIDQEEEEKQRIAKYYNQGNQQKQIYQQQAFLNHPNPQTSRKKMQHTNDSKNSCSNNDGCDDIWCCFFCYDTNDPNNYSSYDSMSYSGGGEGCDCDCDLNFD